jgi:dTDP-4-dehydrorhamnose 3,5-epimerase
MSLRATPTPLPGLLVLDGAPHEDERGSFARLWCRDTLAAAGFDWPLAQANLSTNRARHTLRGLHWQEPPVEEAKVVRCLRGAIWDVAVDIRPASPSFRRWHAEELTAANGRALAIPPGFAHGFLTLAEESDVLYLMGAPYAPALARGARWDDPAFAIAWPATPAVIGPRDRVFPAFGSAG